MTQRIYFDHAATTPLDPRVREAMDPWLGGRFGNPDSRSHSYGWEAEEGVAWAREQVAALLGCRPEEIVFTSGATEANNLAIKGILRMFGPAAGYVGSAAGDPSREIHDPSRAIAASNAPGHLIVSAIEHSAVLRPAERMEREGWAVTRLAPDSDGRIRPESLDAAIGPGTKLVSIMHANNEIGVLQDLPAIAAVCRARGVTLHTDASQSAGKVPCDVDRLGVDLLSCSAHKMHGPKGAGALYVRRRPRRVRLLPEVDGGGQEGGLRSGTLNVPALVGFGEACRLARESMEAEGARIRALRDRLEEGILNATPLAARNGAGLPRLPGISNLRFRGIEAEGLLLALSGVAISAGSACASGSLEPSHVLMALGLAREEAKSSLRFSLGRFNTAAEVESVIEQVIQAVQALSSR